MRTLLFLLLFMSQAFAQATPTNQYSAIAPATPAGVLIASGYHLLIGVQIGSITTTADYLKFYDTAVAPTCGSGTPSKRIMIPVAASAANGNFENIDFTFGTKFFQGIGYCVTGALPDADTTAITANSVLINIDWN